MIDYLHEDELRRVLSHCLTRPGERSALVLLVLGTGVRVGEISGRTENGQQRGGIRLRDITIAGPNEMYIAVWGEKTDKWRTVAVMPELVPHLTKFVNSQRALGHEWLFPTNIRRRPVARRTLQEWWSRTMRMAEVRPLSIHKGRTTYATWEARRLSPAALQDQLGHAPGSATTMQFYTTSIPEMRYRPEVTPRWLKLLTDDHRPLAVAE